MANVKTPFAQPVRRRPLGGAAKRHLASQLFERDVDAGCGKRRRNAGWDTLYVLLNRSPIGESDTFTVRIGFKIRKYLTVKWRVGFSSPFLHAYMVIRKLRDV